MIYFVLCLLLGIATYFLLKEKGRAKKAEKNVSKLELDLKTTTESLHHAASEVESLSKYRVIKDAERRAAEILNTASEESKKIQDEARASAKKLKEKAGEVFTNAQSNADSIIATAREEAKNIAGDAYAALQKADTLEKTARAMKNIIEGYGDQYLIPTTSLLDHLAEDYSHTEAGSELKNARIKTKAMIKSESAATCEYVEEYRKRTAIEFVLDAFNGKVDTILTSVKEDNFGTLEQKIRDAFQTVNHNGTAFRNAKITDLYLASRLDELKWACTVQALKNREREEQRRIKEQMREEEKANREIERALKEAQKEEESITKALEKARKELESAKQEQKAKYEEKLAELMNRLSEAEEKNQRALSMAQQTKRGHVYIISNVGSFGDDVIKIGMTRRLDPMDRVWELGDASVPFDFDVHAMILSEDAPALEKELHEKFLRTRVNKINPRKEFFKIQLGKIREEIERLGIQTHWTMTAEAKEYRESLAKKDESKDQAA